MFQIKGRVFKFGDNIDTDQIYPGRYLELTDHKEIAKHAMEGIDSNFVNKIVTGDIIVAGNNFGCGSSREHAVISIKESGVGAIIAKSFARIFYRNAINMGLPIIDIHDIKVEEGEYLKIEFEKGTIIKEDGSLIDFRPMSENILNIIKVGGIVNYYIKLNEQ
jgi:3-isopropylmalate/(R)-2-methylmalate dehydratase small subunit